MLITNGGKHAVYNAIAAVVDDGDEVLLPAPYWTTYPEPIALSGGVACTRPCDRAQRLPGERRTARGGPDSPHQGADPSCRPRTPREAVYPLAEIEQIGRWAAEHGIWVLTDEIYEHLTYGEAEHFSMPVVVPELRDRCIVLNGVAKTYAMTGWRVGWMIGPSDAVAAARNLQSHCTSNVCNVAQAAALAAVSGPLDAVVEMRRHFDRRRRTMYSLLSGIDGLVCPEPEGAFYAYPDASGLLGRDLGGTRPATTLELADLLLDRARVAVVPGEAFGAGGGLRMSFALGDDDLGEGVGRMVELLGGN